MSENPATIIHIHPISKDFKLKEYLLIYFVIEEAM